MSEDRKLLLQFIGSLTLCDHMGDVSNDVSDVLKRIGFTYDDTGDDWDADLRAALHKLGITTLVGTSLAEDDEE